MCSLLRTEDILSSLFLYCLKVFLSFTCEARKRLSIWTKADNLNLESFVGLMEEKIATLSEIEPTFKQDTLVARALQGDAGIVIMGEAIVNVFPTCEDNAESCESLLPKIMKLYDSPEHNWTGQKATDTLTAVHQLIVGMTQGEPPIFENLNSDVMTTLHDKLQFLCTAEKRMVPRSPNYVVKKPLSLCSSLCPKTLQK